MTMRTLTWWWERVGVSLPGEAALKSLVFSCLNFCSVEATIIGDETIIVSNIELSRSKECKVEAKNAAFSCDLNFRFWLVLQNERGGHKCWSIDAVYGTLEENKMYMEAMTHLTVLLRLLNITIRTLPWFENIRWQSLWHLFLTAEA